MLHPDGVDGDVFECVNKATLFPNVEIAMKRKKKYDHKN